MFARGMGQQHARSNRQGQKARGGGSTGDDGLRNSTSRPFPSIGELVGFSSEQQAGAVVYGESNREVARRFGDHLAYDIPLLGPAISDKPPPPLFCWGCIIPIPAGLGPPIDAP